MESIGPQVLTVLITAVLTSVSSYALWLKRRDVESIDRRGERLASLEKTVELLQNQSVSEPTVRRIVSAEIGAVREEISGIKGAIGGLSELISSLRVELGVLNYIKDRTKE